MKALIFIDHDIICRHFVMNGALASLVKAMDVLFVFPDDGGKRVKLDPAVLNLGAPFVRLPVDPVRQQTWRWLLYADQLKFNRGSHETAIRYIRQSTLGWKPAVLLTLAGLPVGSLVFRWLARRRFAQHPNRVLSELMRRERPDVVLHPSVLDGVFINDLVAECAVMNVPLVVAINSWDNPSTKRAVIGWPDRLLVWGGQTRDHAIRFMKIPTERVVEFGAPQFDAFRDPPRLNRAKFCATYGIDAARRIFLFAGSNAQIDEFSTLAALDDAIEAGKLGNVMIVYRPHPWGGGGKDGKRLAKASWRHVVLDRTMAAYIDRIAAGDYAMSLPDYRDTHDLLCSVDAVISPMSTILVEAALHGKAVVAYFPEASAEVLATMIPLAHFEEFVALDDVPIARSFDELVRVVSSLGTVEDWEARGTRLKAAAQHFVTPFRQPWSERIVEFLTDVSQSRKYLRDQSIAN